VTPVRFDTKIAVVVRNDLPVWQKLNMTSFLVSGIAARVPDSIGRDYEDADGTAYLPMFGQPVLVFEADAHELRRTYDRARSRELTFAVFTDDLFATGNDDDNRAAVKAVAAADLALAGIALRADAKQVDKVVRGLHMHP
jgi:hypothetical protein